MSFETHDVERKVLSILRVLRSSQEALGARVIARSLKDLGIELGERAVRYHLKLMDERPFDVIITDLKMSSMGGMEVLRRIKAIHPDTMVIVITGYATVSSAVEVMKLGACDYLPKPFTPDELRGVVGRRRRQLHRPGSQRFCLRRW